MTHTDHAHIGLEKKDAESIVAILHKYLASEIVLNLKIRNYHWNIEGIVFNDLHAFFEKLYISGSEYVDEVAERIRMLWFHTHASMKKYLELTIIEEEEKISKAAHSMVETLLKDNETIIRGLRKDITEIEEYGDQGTADFLTALIQKHEKDAWMIRSLAREKK